MHFGRIGRQPPLPNPLPGGARELTGGASKFSGSVGSPLPFMGEGLGERALLSVRSPDAISGIQTLHKVFEATMSNTTLHKLALRAAPWALPLGLLAAWQLAVASG